MTPNWLRTLVKQLSQSCKENSDARGNRLTCQSQSIAHLFWPHFRFLRDGYRTPKEDCARLYYERWELRMFENIECEWPVFYSYLILFHLFQGDKLAVSEYAHKLEVKFDWNIEPVPTCSFPFTNFRKYWFVLMTACIWCQKATPYLPIAWMLNTRNPGRSLAKSSADVRFCGDNHYTSWENCYKKWIDLEYFFRCQSFFDHFVFITGIFGRWWIGSPKQTPRSTKETRCCCTSSEYLASPNALSQFSIPSMLF